MVLSKTGIWSWKNGLPGLGGGEEAGGSDVLRREIRRALRHPGLPVVAHHAVRGLELGREQAHVRALDEPGVVLGRRRGLDVRIAADLQGPFREGRDAEGFLGLLHRQLPTCTRPSAAASSWDERTWLSRLPWPASRRAREYSARARAVSRVRTAMSRLRSAVRTAR
jgi:hypothetical protein